MTGYSLLMTLTDDPGAGDASALTTHMRALVSTLRRAQLLPDALKGHLLKRSAPK